MCRFLCVLTRRRGNVFIINEQQPPSPSSLVCCSFKVFLWLQFSISHQQILSTVSLMARFSSLVVLFLAILTIGCHGTYFLTISPLTPYAEWKYDGNLGYAFLDSDAVPGLVPFTLLRDKSVESPNTYDLRYLYTASLEIKQRLTNGGPWVEEEIAFYVYPTETKKLPTPPSIIQPCHRRYSLEHRSGRTANFKGARLLDIRRCRLLASRQA